MWNDKSIEFNFLPTHIPCIARTTNKLTRNWEKQEKMYDYDSPSLSSPSSKELQIIPIEFLGLCVILSLLHCTFIITNLFHFYFPLHFFNLKIISTFYWEMKSRSHITCASYIGEWVVYLPTCMPSSSNKWSKDKHIKNITPSFQFQVKVNWPADVKEVIQFWKISGANYWRDYRDFSTEFDTMSMKGMHSFIRNWFYAACCG